MIQWFIEPGMIQWLPRAVFQTIQLCIEVRYLLRLFTFDQLVRRPHRQ